jgi:CheY-like chemotaxis protein
MVSFQPNPASGARVLVIEDDDANRLLFVDYLTYAGFNVLALPDGTRLEHVLNDFQPDALVLDLDLPGPNGYCILERLKTLLGQQTLPVIVVSGYAFLDDQERALALGACHYWVKPVRMKDLVQSLQSVLAVEP